MPSISVIIPVFRAEKYIERCARSLFEQTLDDVEFIFVNDATPDSSMEVLLIVIADYPEKKVVILNHSINRGAAKARETGLAVASGDYITFCDSDDWVEKDYCKAMYDKAISSKADIVSCRYMMFDASKSWNELDRKDSIYYNNGDVLRPTISWESSPFLCKKLFNHSLFGDNIIHPERFHGDDWVIMTQTAYFAKKTAFVDKVLYYYNNTTANSHRLYTKDETIKRCRDIQENVNIVSNWLETIGLNRIYRSEITKAKVFAKKQLVGMYDKEIRQVWIHTFPEVNLSLLFCPLVRTDFKILHLSIVTGVYPIAKRIKRFLKGTDGGK